MASRIIISSPRSTVVLSAKSRAQEKEQQRRLSAAQPPSPSPPPNNELQKARSRQQQIQDKINKLKAEERYLTEVTIRAARNKAAATGNKGDLNRALSRGDQIGAQLGRLYGDLEKANRRIKQAKGEPVGSLRAKAQREGRPVTTSESRRRKLLGIKPNADISDGRIDITDVVPGGALEEAFFARKQQRARERAAPLPKRTSSAGVLTIKGEPVASTTLELFEEQSARQRVLAGLTGANKQLQSPDIITSSYKDFEQPVDGFESQINAQAGRQQESSERLGRIANLANWITTFGRSTPREKRGTVGLSAEGGVTLLLGGPFIAGESIASASEKAFITGRGFIDSPKNTLYEYIDARQRFKEEFNPKTPQGRANIIVGLSGAVFGAASAGAGIYTRPPPVKGSSEFIILQDVQRGVGKNKPAPSNVLDSVVTAGVKAERVSGVRGLFNKEVLTGFKRDASSFEQRTIFGNTEIIKTIDFKKGTSRIVRIRKGKTRSDRTKPLSKAEKKALDQNSNIKLLQQAGRGKISQTDLFRDEGGIKQGFKIDSVKSTIFKSESPTSLFSSERALGISITTERFQGVSFQADPLQVVLKGSTKTKVSEVAATPAKRIGDANNALVLRPPSGKLTERSFTLDLVSAELIKLNPKNVRSSPILDRLAAQEKLGDFQTILGEQSQTGILSREVTLNRLKPIEQEGIITSSTLIYGRGKSGASLPSLKGVSFQLPKVKIRSGRLGKKSQAGLSFDFERPGFNFEKVGFDFERPLSPPSFKEFIRSPRTVSVSKSRSIPQTVFSQEVGFSSLKNTQQTPFTTSLDQTQFLGSDTELQSRSNISFINLPVHDTFYQQTKQTSQTPPPSQPLNFLGSLGGLPTSSRFIGGGGFFAPSIGSSGGGKGRRKAKKRRTFKTSRSAINIVFGVQGIDPRAGDITGLLPRGRL